MDNKTYPVLMLAGGVLIGSNTVLAEGVRITPGQWEFTTVSKMPMMPQPRTTTETECITRTEFTPGDLVTDNDECTLTDVSVQDNTMKWIIRCPASMGNMTGEGEFTSDGSTAHGSMQMSMSVNGQSMSLENRWEGKRIGSCN